ncbi:2-succinyl-5-enolpyruvyl-6-hydroxy-3-cyclohexene-1-carboxylic-acid synthase [Costertonia aggregata]|uniref:2-succinyl-5-enolpyruvyl-6-hydroxy-3-cyclohexene-1-carboxylate synthase n=1 Tax=Costertonia aggregata TaxID=343403 RepID=A0A7H9AUJ1_9FLAO|nr:2-succinyl-5-enolpyruvyl-6-hydroxy-3-cyclohexene-1-carboxylic-acid synthase [Costertonia aggregata]QLG47163.1 2-succinyl-5-enolpyruvyl-6-hydroxy-3-cyclohexene-1-carboxylic-acid synthase [Costertonia aggregata]
MKHSTIPVAQTVVYHCKQRGIKNIVISPGSRNAPLTISFTEDPFFNCFSIVDERCAAFFALGMAQNQKQPVVVVCTSGSALLNYYPAVSEAFYSDIPIIIISADRPFYKIDVGDGQTIRQDNVFARHIGYSANLKQDVSHATDRIKRYVPEILGNDSIKEIQQNIQRYNDSELNTAFGIVYDKSAPVHINVPFEEPLYNTVDNPTTSPIVAIEHVEHDVLNVEGFRDIWNASKRKMVLVGVNHPNMVDQELLDILANDPSVIVMEETTSNLHHPNFFSSIDSIIAPIEKSSDNKILFERLRPDILLTFGGLVVSKKIKAFLREFTPKHHWHVDERKAYDTFFCLSQHFKHNINTFLIEFLRDSKHVESDYYPYWSKVKANYETKREQYLKEIPFTDMLAFAHITKTIPEGYQLQLANSSTVRYAQLFHIKASLHVFCNRGTSGIDGSTSTAIGCSIFNKAPTLLITGDLSFFYDSNALWNKYMRPDFRIIVINNSGGGIFRILPGKEDSENFETFFETKHGLSAEHLCKMYDLEYTKAHTAHGLKLALANFYEDSARPKVLEINTPRLLNNKILLGYFDFIS